MGLVQFAPLHCKLPGSAAADWPALWSLHGPRDARHAWASPRAPQLLPSPPRQQTCRYLEDGHAGVHHAALWQRLQPHRHVAWEGGRRVPRWRGDPLPDDQGWAAHQAGSVGSQQSLLTGAVASGYQPTGPAALCRLPSLPGSPRRWGGGRPPAPPPPPPPPPPTPPPPPPHTHTHPHPHPHPHHPTTHTHHHHTTHDQHHPPCGAGLASETTHKSKTGDRK